MKRRDNKRLYEQIMNSISTEVKKALNELSPEVYRNAADKRQAQIDALPTKLRKMMGADINSPAELRAHADKLQAELDAKREAEEEAAEREAKRLKRNQSSRESKTIQRLMTKYSNVLNDKTMIQFYSQMMQYLNYKFNNMSIKKDSDSDKRKKLCAMWKEAPISLIRKIDEGGYDYEWYSDVFSKFNDSELDIIKKKIIPNIIKKEFTALELVKCCYIEDALNKSITATDEETERLGEKFGLYGPGVIVEIGNEKYVFSEWGDMTPVKDLGYKYMLSGDFRGEVDEVISQAECYGATVIQYPEYSDCIVLSNSKRDLKQIEKYLWDEHIMAFGGIDTV